MRLIVKGLKRNGKYKLYDVEKNNHVDMQKDKPIKGTLAPFPFEHFSSIDAEVDGWEKCYLSVEAELSQEEFNQLNSLGIRRYRFKSREITLVGENLRPLEYTLVLKNIFESALSSNVITTWIIHWEINSAREKESMEKCLDIASNSTYGLDITLDKYTVEYTKKFMQYVKDKKEVTFGRYGSLELAEIDFTKLSDDELMFYVRKIGMQFISELITKELFTIAFYKKNILGTDIELMFLQDLYEEELKTLSKKLDMDFLFSRYMTLLIENKNLNDYVYDDNYDTVLEELSTENPIIETEHHSPYDYYCCEDCDGYDICDRYTEEELDGYDIEIDNRVELLEELVPSRWVEYLSKKSAYLFKGINPEVVQKLNYCSDLEDKLEHIFNSK